MVHLYIHVHQIYHLTRKENDNAIVCTLFPEIVVSVLLHSTVNVFHHVDQTHIHQTINVFVVLDLLLLDHHVFVVNNLKVNALMNVQQINN